MLWHCQYAQQVGIDKKTIISSMFPGGIILIIKKESLCIYKDIYQNLYIYIKIYIRKKIPRFPQRTKIHDDYIFPLYYTCCQKIIE